MVTFLLGNSNKSQYINVVHFVYSIVIFTQSWLRVAKILERELNKMQKSTVDLN